MVYNTAARTDGENDGVDSLEQIFLEGTGLTKASILTLLRYFRATGLAL
jgi:hypothetical protein